jgi:excisionase family DNA binding protein
MQENNEGKTERLTMTVEEAGAALGISRATAYMLVSTGRLPSIRISDRRIVIPRRSIDDLLASAGTQKSHENSAGDGNGTDRDNGHSSAMR